MIKLKYNWIGLIAGIFISTIVAILLYNSIINVGLGYIENAGGTAAREMMESRLDNNAGEIYWMPYLYMMIVVMIFMGFAYLINYFLLRKKLPFVWRLTGIILFSCICSGILLGSIEPYIARDAVEYGVRQDLNQRFEIVGYGFLNFVGYFIPLIGAIALTFFTVPNAKEDELEADII